MRGMRLEANSPLNGLGLQKTDYHARPCGQQS